MIAVEFLHIREKGNGRFDLALSIESVKRHFEVGIIDRDGVFGVDMPDELGLLLRNFPHSQKKVVRSVREIKERVKIDSNAFP